MARIGSIKDIYSDDTLKAQNQLNTAETSKPGAYQSPYTDKMNQIMDNILNKGDFSYDFNADALYQQYKDQYTQLGKQAAMDAAANMSALTGGFGNSYATTAATQANQQYLTQLNNVIPQLYNLAMDKARMERQDTYNQFQALGAQEDRNYGKYRDAMSDWRSDRDYYYGKYAGSVNYDQYVSSYNQTEDEYLRAQQRWQQEQEAAQQRWAAEMAYQKERDAVEDDRWAKEYALSLARSKGRGGSGGGSGSGSGSSTKKTQSNISEDMRKMAYLDAGAERRPSVEYEYTDADVRETILTDMIGRGQMSPDLADFILKNEEKKYRKK